MNEMLHIEGLSMSVPIDGGWKPLLDAVGFHVAQGESVGLVGESGSGKSLSCRAVVGLRPPGARLGGSILVEGLEVIDRDPRRVRQVRTQIASMIFQDPRAHINPIHTIGDFLVEGLVRARGAKRADAWRRAEGLLGEVGIEDASRRMRQHPHELSGGLLQRVMIASALMNEPRLLLADEPTTALDVTTQEEVMAILDELRRERGLSMVFVTHDLDLAAAVCDRLVVMQNGRVVESMPVDRIYEGAQHPYTKKLLSARIAFGSETDREVADHE